MGMAYGAPGGPRARRAGSVSGTGRGPDADAPLTASGTIYADEVRIASEIGGRIAEVRVAPGQPVRAGDVLVVLEGDRIEDQLTEARAAVASAQADLAALRAGARADEIAAARAALAAAVAERDGAYAAWVNAQKALRDPQQLDAQIVEARTQVRLAEQATIQAQAELEAEKLLAQQKKAGTREREAADLVVQAAERALDAAQADLAAAQTALDWLLTIRARPLALWAQANAAEGRYRSAEAGVAVAQAALDDLIAGPTPHEIAVAEQAVRLAEARARAIEATRDRLTLVSPVDGVVLDQALHAGELAAPAATVLTVSDLSGVTLTAYVAEDRVGQVQVGQEVRVTVDSYPGRVFRGRVSQIGDEPEYTPRNVATVEERINTYYAVDIALDNPDGALKPGMPADVTF